MRKHVHQYCPCGNMRKKNSEMCGKCARDGRVPPLSEKDRQLMETARKSAEHWQESVRNGKESSAVIERPVKDKPKKEKKTLPSATIPEPDENDDRDTFDLEVYRVLAITEKAFLFVVENGEKVWVPRSHVIRALDAKSGHRIEKINSGAEDLEVEITAWIAEKKGWLEAEHSSGMPMTEDRVPPY